MEKQYFSYIRVSTTRQGDRGVSLQEQQDAIVRYAQRQNLKIARSFEEQETAAKRGRPVFSEMLRLLKRGIANGVVIHKIDRGARNLKDWADLGELIDIGVEVHFANESLDLNTRGGRLSADIQAVVAADFIRNLREETKKGFYGRLKQGLYPIRAPIGYLDCGGGKVKAPDPKMEGFVREAFDLYASGNVSLPNHYGQRCSCLANWHESMRWTRTTCEPFSRRAASPHQIEDALAVCFSFNVVGRLADAFGFAVPGPEAFDAGAKCLFTRGYR